MSLHDIECTRLLIILRSVIVKHKNRIFELLGVITIEHFLETTFIKL